MKKIIFVNLIFISLLFILLELLIGTFKLSGIMGIDSNLFETKENMYQFKKNSQGKVYGKMIYTDINGFRIPEKNFKYSNDKPSIFFIGDSTTFGNGVKEKNTFVGKLRIKKNNFNFYNSAVIGYQIFHHEKNIDMINNFSNINKIFYVFTLNDIFEVEQIESTDNQLTQIPKDNFFNKLKNMKLFSIINVYLRNKSYLYMFIKGIASDPQKRYFEYVKEYYEQKDELVRETNYFAKLKSITDNKDINLMIIILPYEYQTRKDQCFEKNLTPQSKITSILLSLDIKYKDYTHLFCSNKNPKKLFYKFDPMHLSKSGHELVFSEIVNEI